ncbi:MAG: DUF1593 domain-containing protein [Bacteroidaceae bacterium]|nr:DUF1593 domain-containing protein [Bacteroidaceae bacterium]
MKNITVILFLMLFSVMASAKKNEEMKPRLVVMTDIGDCNVEPDDMESAVRLLAFADMFEIEAIMTTVGWNCDPYPAEWSEYLTKVIDAYECDVRNLMKRSSQSAFLSADEENGKQKIGYWPSADYVRSRAMAGSQRAGIKVIGEGNDSPGSDFLIKLADEDDSRPIWVAAWGGANTLAQAIWRVKQTRSASELKSFVNKFRVFTITDQDMKYDMRMNRAYSSHMWMRREFKDDLKFIWDEGTWQLFCDLGKENWEKYKSGIQGKGAMGKIYPDYKWGVEGDTPSFLYVIPNGLSNPEDPAQAGWSGCHAYGISPDSLTFAWNSWQEPYRSITTDYLRRFYPDELSDFMARMQWADCGEGNHNPVAVVNKKKGLDAVCVKAKAGKTLRLDASMSFDPDGDALSYSWWHQPEAGTYHTSLLIADASKDAIEIAIPQDAAGKTIHIVCEIHDKGPFSLAAYRRIIIDVK